MLFPKHRALRWLAALWLLASVAILAFMVLRPEWQADERRALSTLVPLYFLSLPLGHAGLAACNKLKLALYLDSGFVPGIFTEGIILWLSLVVLGYAQWFLLVPWISRKCRDAYGVLFGRDAAR
jgi:hypothetical protein